MLFGIRRGIDLLAKGFPVEGSSRGLAVDFSTIEQYFIIIYEINKVTNI